MKLTAAIFAITLMHVSASSLAQKVTFRKNGASLTEIFRQIKSQTGYNILYSPDLIDENAKLNVDFKNTDLKDVLEEVINKQEQQYSIDHRNILITRSQKESIFDKFVKAVTAIPVHGKVLDQSGNPLPNVTIMVKGTSKAIIANNGGEFYISEVNKGDVLIFSYIGYQSQEVIIKDKAELTVKLQISINGLNDVVVIGYGTTQRKDLTGAVATIDAKSVEDVPFTTIDNALAGKAAGVEVTKTDGSPGGAVRVRIRGSSSFMGGNDPLYVIDGIPIQVQSNFQSPGFDVSNPMAQSIDGSGGAAISTSFVNGLNTLSGLNVDDIESITILKDASSTAIYGSKAANGVVIITTKKGKKDMKPVITASYYSTVSSPVTPHVLDAAQYRSLITEAAQNDANERNAAGQLLPLNTNAILNTPSAFFGTTNTDWAKQVTRTTMSDNAELTVQGGGNSSKYFNSISYNSQPGVISNSDYHRIAGKINLENDIGSKFKFITNFIISYVNQNISDGVYDQALVARPDYAPYDAAGNLTDFSAVGASLGFQNPVALLHATNNAKTFSLLGSLSGVYDITKGLEFKTTVSLNSQAYNQRNYSPSYLDISSPFTASGTSEGIGGNSNSRLTDWFLENTLTYTKAFKDNRIDILAGQSYETRKTSFFSATGYGYPNDNVLTGLSSAATPLAVTGDDPAKPQSYLLSFYLRANYSYKDKYLFTFTGRSDGSSKFGPDNKFGYFPSGAIAWRISRESFLKNVTWIDDIKLRGSYGLTGTQNIGDQTYRSLYSPGSYAGSSSVVPTQLGNTAIKWESTREADGGLDISLFGNRLSATVDYYNKQTGGDLLSLPVPTSSSFTSVISNAAGIKNTGVEVTLQGDIIRNDNFKWSSSINVTWSNSLVTELNENTDLTQIGDLTGLEFGNTTLVQGKPLGLLTGLTVTGIIRNQAQLDAYKKQLGIYASQEFPFLNIGDPMYKLAITGPTDNSIDFNTIIGSAAPKYFGGMTQDFTYKNFELRFYFSFSEGGKLLWGDHISSVEFVGTANANASILGRYTAANTNAADPRLVLNDSFYARSNLDVFNSSYLKLRTLTLNYHFSKSKWMDKAGMKNASLFASATNIFTITKYPGNDPETSDDPYSVGGGYFDVSNYPAVRTFSLGLKVSF